MHFEALLHLWQQQLSPLTRKPDSQPDRFAIVSDLESALRELGHPQLARVADRLMAPITIAHDGGKLSLYHARAGPARALARPSISRGASRRSCRSITATSPI